MFCNKCGNKLGEDGKCPKCDNLQGEIKNYNFNNEIEKNYKYNNVYNGNNINNTNNEKPVSNVNSKDYVSNVNNEFCEKNKNKAKPKKKKKKVFLVIILLIILAIIGIFVVFPFIKNKIAENKQKEIVNLQQPTSSEHLKKDFEDGKITADKYVKELAYQNFDSSKMDEKYKLANNDVQYNHVLDIAKKHQDELSKETLIYLYKKFCMADVEFDANAKKSEIDNPKYGAVYAAHDKSLRTTISKAILSDNKKFLIWYTDTGDSKVSEKDVKTLANEIEEVVQKLEDESGVTYKFKNTAGTGTGESKKTEKKMKEILEKCDIDEKYIDECLNIYMCYTNKLGKDDEKSAIAYYVPSIDWLLKKVGGILDGISGEGELGEISSVPNFPYINIRPDATNDREELKIIYTHELFHHFQKYYCGNGKEGEAKSDLFTTETTANWMSAKVNDSKNKENFMSRWATRYTLNCDKQLNRVCNGTGYANLVFAEIYSNVVTDGKTKMLDSMKHEDALKYLVEQAGEQFDDVMVELAKQNILNDFSHQTFKVYELPENSLELNMNLAKNEETANYYSMKYYFLDKNTFKYNTFIDISTKYSELDYVIIGKKNGKYAVIDEGELDSKHSISIETNNYFNDYQQIILCIVNANSNLGKYEITTMKEQLAITLTEANDFLDIANRKIIFDKGEYIELHITDLVELFKQLSSFARAGGNLALQESNDSSVKQSVNEMFNELDEFDKGVDELKKSNMKVVRISSIPIDRKIAKQDLHDKIRNSYSGLKFKIVDKNIDNDTRISVGIIADLTAKNKLSFCVVCTSENSDSFAYFIEIE